MLELGGCIGDHPVMYHTYLILEETDLKNAVHFTYGMLIGCIAELLEPYGDEVGDREEEKVMQITMKVMQAGRTGGSWIIEVK